MRTQKNGREKMNKEKKNRRQFPSVEETPGLKLKGLPSANRINEKCIDLNYTLGQS